jgi:hypothetical protein
MNPIIIWTCHNGWNQRWSVVSTARKTHNARRSNIQSTRFMIRTHMRGNRVLYWNEHIGHGDYRLRIRTARNDVGREWWIYHPQTQTIRLYSSRSYAISNKYNQGVQRGKAVVMRAYRTGDQSIYYDRRTHRIHNGRDERFCIDVWGGQNRENQHTTYWTCHKGANQRWQLKYYPSVPTNLGFRHGQRFKIESKIKATE